MNALRLIILAAFTFAFVPSAKVLAEEPEELEEVGYVNDFANIIPTEQEAALEQRLVAYETETTNEIAVVTVNSLNGNDVVDWSNELFRQWGIGKAASNNGVLIVVVPDGPERVARIHTGYGMEAYLTDADASRIGADTMPQHFRNGDFGTGITAAADGVIQHLTIAMMTPGQRQALMREQEQAREMERQRANDALLNGLGYVTFAGFLIAIFVWLIRAHRRRRRENARLNAIKAEFALNDEIFDDCVDLFNKRDHLSGLPIWANEIIARADRKGEEAINSASNVRENLPPFSRKKLPELEKALARFAADCSTLRNVVSVLESVPEQVEAFRAETDELVETTLVRFDELMMLCEILDEDGFTYISLFSEADGEELGDKIAILQSDHQARGKGREDNSDALHARATALLTHMRKLFDQLDEFSAQGNRMADLYRELPGKLHEAEMAVNWHVETMSRLRPYLPDVVLDPHEQPRLAEELRANRALYETLDIAEAKVYRTIHSFSQHVQQIVGFYDRLRTACETLHKLERENEEAKLEYESIRGMVAQAIVNAQSEVDDPDTEHSTRQKLIDAKEKAERAVFLAGLAQVHWASVVNTLKSARSLANEAKSQAEADQKQAVKRRRKAAEDAAAAAAAATRSKSSSSSHSSGGFGGFGGGRSGGGGASGSFGGGFGGGSSGGGGANIRW